MTGTALVMLIAAVGCSGNGSDAAPRPPETTTSTTTATTTTTTTVPPVDDFSSRDPFEPV